MTKGHIDAAVAHITAMRKARERAKLRTVPTAETRARYQAQYHEPIRPIYADDNGCAFCTRAILGNEYRVHYGLSDWPSRSFWIVPGTSDVE